MDALFVYYLFVVYREADVVDCFVNASMSNRSVNRTVFCRGCWFLNGIR